MTYKFPNDDERRGVSPGVLLVWLMISALMWAAGIWWLI